MNLSPENHIIFENRKMFKILECLLYMYGKYAMAETNS